MQLKVTEVFRIHLHIYTAILHYRLGIIPAPTLHPTS